MNLKKRKICCCFSCCRHKCLDIPAVCISFVGKDSGYEK